MGTRLLPRSTFSEGRRLLEGAFQLDQSTSVPELGSLFDRDGDKPLQRLKRVIAGLYGVAWSFPSTHGTTALNVLALMSACPAGGRVLVNRDAHSSVMAAMIHGGFEPVYLVPPYDHELGVSLGPTASSFQQLLDRERVDCVFLTSPTYFGIVGDIGAIIALAHERSLPVVVDAAHAPHFHFCSALPTGAEDLQADFVTQSTHKVASALSQGSLLLVRDERLVERLYENVNDLGLISTSFSYPILASIELGVRQLAEEGDEIWTRSVERAEAFRSAVRSLPRIDCFGREQCWKAAFRGLDPTRVTLDVSGVGITGFEFEHRLHAMKIYPEMATLRHVLFLITPGTKDDDLHRLFAAVETVANDGRRQPLPLPPPPPDPPAMAMIPRLAKFAPKRTVPITDAVGHVSGETIATYPPGVPIIAAGEVFSEDVVEYLRCMQRHGAVLKGASDGQFRTVKVV